jgi:hypothetical protein
MDQIVTPARAVTIIEALRKHGIDPILYGSLGVSLYLGKFKDFSDIDLLVRPNWLETDWDKLQHVLSDIGFILVDAREHEFKNDTGVSVAFAKDTVLVRDKIVTSLDETVIATIGTHTVRTLTPAQFRQAYRFSEKDGYRKHSRGKKDAVILRLLDDYLDT